MILLNFDPFPVLETDRLILREISLDDAGDIFELRNNEAAMKYINRPALISIDDAVDLIKKMTDISERISWGIILKNENKIIGSIGYHKIEKEHSRAEIGYMLSPEYWNTGIMSEALSKVIEY